MTLELSVFEFFYGLTGQSGLFDWFIVFAGKYLPYLLSLAAVLLIFLDNDWKERFRKFSFLALAAILSRALLTEIIRFFFYRERPFAELNLEPLISHAATASFPSGHAAFYFAIAFAIFTFNRKWGVWFSILALLVSVARVISGIHWPLDIIAGLLVALVSVFVVKWILSMNR